MLDFLVKKVNLTLVIEKEFDHEDDNIAKHISLVLFKHTIGHKCLSMLQCLSS